MALRKPQAGFRLMNGEWFWALYDAVNVLITQAAGTVAGIYTGTFNGVLGGVTAAAATVTNFTQNGIWTQYPQIIAAAGSNSQANATAITKSAVIVTTVSATTRAIRLPTAATGKRVFVNNGAAANAVKVYPGTGDRIGAAATNALGSSKPAAGKGNIYFAQDAGTWRVMAGA